LQGGGVIRANTPNGNDYPVRKGKISTFLAFVDH
jgi:hypothetical protein